MVEDQLPVSVDSNVHVRGSFSLPGKVNEKTGIITWNLMMMPNEKLEIKTEIVIDASKDSGIGSDVFWRM
ncbi:MAG: DUF4139 domain-containing protein [Lachnospiraceae bacterium]